MLALLAAGPVQAQISIPAGATFNLGGGTLDAAGTAVQIDGQLQLGNGNVFGVSDFTVGSAGQALFGAGNIILSGNWDNQGSLDAGNSLVAFIDGTSAASAVLGSTRFASVDFSSGIGKRYLFESGATQTVANALIIQGTAAAPIQIDVSMPGATAFLDLLTGGSQNIAHVGVSDVHASGQHLAPTLSNEGGRGNANGWFGAVIGALAVPIPTLSRWAVLLLILAIALVARRQHRRRTAYAHTTLNSHTGD